MTSLVNKLIKILQARFLCHIIITDSGEKGMQHPTQALKEKKVCLELHTGRFHHHLPSLSAPHGEVRTSEGAFVYLKRSLLFQVSVGLKFYPLKSLLLNLLL